MRRADSLYWRSQHESYQDQGRSGQVLDWMWLPDHEAVVLHLPRVSPVLQVYDARTHPAAYDLMHHIALDLSSSRRRHIGSHFDVILLCWQEVVALFPDHFHFLDILTHDIHPVLLAERCNFMAMFDYIAMMCCLNVSSLTRVYCDKTTEVRIKQFTVSAVSLMAKFEGVSTWSGAQTEVGGFRLRDTISRKRCEITVLNRNNHTATEHHMPYGITQSYLPSRNGDFPAFTPAEAGTLFSDPGGMQAELTWAVVISHDSSPEK